ncbi:MAG: serine hydrolase [Planctomycetaceae bacterium]
MMTHSTLRVLVLLTLLSATAAAQDSGSIDEVLAEKLRPLIEAHEGDVAVSVRHLDSGAAFHYRSDTVMPTASLIKFPVMIEAYRQEEAGRLDLSATVTLTKNDKVPGSGILTKHFSDGAELTLRDAIRLMIAYSDNTATNLVLDRIGLTSTADTMAAMGFPETKIHSKVYRGSTSAFPERSREFGLGSTTSSDMIALLDQLHRRELVSPEASDAMLDHLTACESRDMLPSLLPDDVRVAHKSGSVSNARTDAGILFTNSGPIAICVLTNNNKDQSWGSNNAAQVLGGQIARTVFDHFNPSLPNDTSDRTTLRQGDFGLMVEAVQRTLNSMLEPSPQLSIDGDFGPATLAAVRDFQRQSGLQTSGVVDSDVWKALSPLLTEDEPVPDPIVVNAQVLPLAEADSVDGPPFVTCRAWAIADDSGGVLFSENADSVLDIASTTKIMTACVVLRLAQDNAAVLNETVTFSLRADRTRGSTAAIREGEQLPVSEVLYGLLLPSGNDAAVALAEHFGNRLRHSPSEERRPEADPLRLFVDEMNRTATELGMTKTTFRNPSGLTEDGHSSTAADLVKLAATAVSIPAFRRYVSTRQRGCTVTGSGGYQRNVLWKNTNRLLAISGYEGVKTGTTDDAGACLVSQAERNGTRLLMVVLGSTSSDARYTDSRNLYRWAWQQLSSTTQTAAPDTGRSAE